MSSKTISIDHDAYEILQREKADAPRQSFSDVIRRLRANQRARTVKEMLAMEEEIYGHLLKPRRHARHAAIR